MAILASEAVKTLRPDTDFVLHIDALTHKARSGYRCNVYDGRVIAHGPKLMTGPQALTYLADNPGAVICVMHVW